MLLKEEQIITYLKEHDLFDSSGENHTVFGITMPSTLDYILFGAASVLSTKYNVVNLSDKGIAILAIDNVTGKIVEGEHAFIPKEQITKLEVKSKFTHHRLKIETPAGNTGFKLNKVMIGAGWHKRNLPNVLQAVETKSFK
ncbi:hypothetical protein JSQ81_13365 [Sporosarcina sp. Marseille-Q4063]|uniref:hypothetical protein n=1 Tax=Sporosarcina sp. Marseille-Q4063 TaxID=2810514 RepID=UPI001BB0384B|nr:hypothetical protein [Sporosarcina sp. Marseille-Q4063]QUW20803.1 hypothetical protein JSQ81_13365 [Sporosarcina sp. Marseille-Q4063]